MTTADFYRRRNCPHHQVVLVEQSTTDNPDKHWWQCRECGLRFKPLATTPWPGTTEEE